MSSQQPGGSKGPRASAAARTPLRGPSRDEGNCAAGTANDATIKLAGNQLTRTSSQQSSGGGSTRTDGLSRVDLLRLLSYLEGELQARDVAIATLKSERAKYLLAPARYGKLGGSGPATDPWAALQRDSLADDQPIDEAEVAAMCHSQLKHLDALIDVQRRAHQRAKKVLYAAERRHARALRELEAMSARSKADAAQGDDVCAALEGERERLRGEMEGSKAEIIKLQQELDQQKKLLLDEKERHKAMVLYLLQERKQLLVRLAEERATHRPPSTPGIQAELQSTLEHLRRQLDDSLSKESAAVQRLHDTRRALDRERQENNSLREIVHTQEEDLNLIRQNILAKARQHQQQSASRYGDASETGVAMSPYQYYSMGHSAPRPGQAARSMSLGSGAGSPLGRQSPFGPGVWDCSQQYNNRQAGPQWTQNRSQSMSHRMVMGDYDSPRRTATRSAPTPQQPPAMSAASRPMSSSALPLPAASYASAASAASIGAARPSSAGARPLRLFPTQTSTSSTDTVCSVNSPNASSGHKAPQKPSTGQGTSKRRGNQSGAAPQAHEAGEMSELDAVIASLSGTIEMFEQQENVADLEVAGHLTADGDYVEDIYGAPHLYNTNFGTLPNGRPHGVIVQPANRAAIRVMNGSPGVTAAGPSGEQSSVQVKPRRSTSLPRPRPAAASQLHGRRSSPTAPLQQQRVGGRAAGRTQIVNRARTPLATQTPGHSAKEAGAVKRPVLVVQSVPGRPGAAAHHAATAMARAKMHNQFGNGANVNGGPRSAAQV